MLVTPNEVETMKEAIEKAHGKVATYGLGLGYFPYMTSMMDSVESVTVVELDETEEAIRRFLEDEGRKNEGGTSSAPEEKGAV